MRQEYRIINPEVLYTEAALTSVDHSDICHLKQLSTQNPRKRIRLCAHPSPEDALHEMLIVHAAGAYVRPHRHPGKSESTQVIEGLAEVVLFEEAGKIARVISLGDYASGKTFYYRMDKPVFHTLIIRSEFLVFHEITNGPFDRANTIFAPWAPRDEDLTEVENFMTELEQRLTT